MRFSHSHDSVFANLKDQGREDVLSLQQHQHQLHTNNLRLIEIEFHFLSEFKIQVFCSIACASLSLFLLTKKM